MNELARHGTMERWLERTIAYAVLAVIEDMGTAWHGV